MFLCLKQMFNAKIFIKDFHLSVFQNYGNPNPTRETKFKVAVDVADPNSLMKLVPLSTDFPSQFYVFYRKIT